MSAMKVNVEISQTDHGDSTITLSQRLLGVSPFVLMLFGVTDDGVLDVDVEVGGPREDLSDIGSVLKTIGTAIQQHGEALAAEALADPEQTARAQMTVDASPTGA